MKTPTSETHRFAGRRTSDAILRRAVETAHMGLWQVELHSTSDMTKNFPTWSDETYRIYGHEPRSFAPSTERYFAQVPAEDHAAVNAAIARAFADHSEYHVEHRIIRPDGAIRLVEQRATIELDAAGAPVRMVGTVLDVTDRRRIEDALRGPEISSQLLAQLVEHSHDAIISVALDGVLTTWNPAAERMFSWRAEEVIGRHVSVIVATDRQHELNHNLALAFAGKAIGAVETVRLRRDGSLIDVELSASPILDRDGTVLGASAIYRDITRQRRLASQLEHAQRLESVGRLAGGVAHDFNNLLMAISGYAELVMMELPEDAPAREDLRALLASADRGARLTRQLLAFGRRQVLHPIGLDLNAVLRNMEGVLRPLTGGDVTLRLQLSTAPALVRADRAQIEQVVVNLVANARDAMPHGGVLDLDTAIVHIGADDGPLMPPSVDPGHYVRLTVRDTGIGMDAAAQSRLFEPFFSTKPRGTSTGMGLATTYGIIKQTGGFITVESEQHRGSTFRVFLPLQVTSAATSSAPGAAEAEFDAAPHGGGETILLVEDDDAVRATTKAMLNRLGYTVVDTAAPADALRIIRAHSSRIHLLLTDVTLPEMTGIRLGEIVRAEQPAIRVICMSGYPGTLEEHGTLQPGVNFLQKPFAAEALARVLRGALAR